MTLCQRLSIVINIAFTTTITITITTTECYHYHHRIAGVFANPSKKWPFI